MKYDAILVCEDGSLCYSSDDCKYSVGGTSPNLAMLKENGILVDFTDLSDSLADEAPVLDMRLDESTTEVDHVPGSFGSLKRTVSRAGIKAWVLWWERKGAKVGRREGTQIVWRTGEKIPIGSYMRGAKA